MLLAGWEDRIVKNCDRGLENAVRGRGRGQYFEARGHMQFFTMWSDPKADFVNELAYAPSSNHSKQTSE